MSKKQEKNSAEEMNASDDVTSAESTDYIEGDVIKADVDSGGAVEIEVKHQGSENSSADELNTLEDADEKQSDNASTVVGQVDEYQTELEKSSLLLEDARSKADQHWEQVLRLQADMENLRRRNERELEKAHKYALDQFVEELLPVIDSLELGLTAVVDQDANVEKLVEGTELTLNLLKSSLQKFGITELNPISEAFNPEFHQAMTMQESDKVSPNTVLAVFQKGYKMHDRLVRPARVVVAKAMEEAAENVDLQEDSSKESDAPAKVSDTGIEMADSAESIGTQIDEKA